MKEFLADAFKSPIIAVKIALPLVLVIGSIWLIFVKPSNVGYAPEQPIHYSHAKHAGEYGIKCQYCHTTVAESKKAGVPSTNICMNCHGQAVAQNSPEIKKLKALYEQGKSPKWVRIHNLPDHVRFSHAPHIKALMKDKESIVELGHDDLSIKACAHCHGDIRKMEVVAQVKDHNMGWCINCHRERQKKGDNAMIHCSTCHY